MKQQEYYEGMKGNRILNIYGVYFHYKFNSYVQIIRI